MNDDQADYERWWQALWVKDSDHPDIALILIDRNGPNYHPHDLDMGIYLPNPAVGFDYSGASGPPNGVKVLSRDRARAVDALRKVVGSFGVDTGEWEDDE